jgi:hypothetical protein
MQYIHDKINVLKSRFADHPEIVAEITHIQNVMNGEFAKLRSQVDKLSLNLVDGIEITEATSNNTRLTISPNCRTTLKIARNIQSENVKTHLINFAKFARDLYKGDQTVRGKIGYAKDENALICSLQDNSHKFCQTVKMELSES